MREAITGKAAGVPFTALPPDVPDADGRGPAALVVVWHMMDAPRTHAAFAAALPLAGVPAWRVFLGLPWSGDRPVGATMAEAQADPMGRYIDPVVSQAVAEFPAALAALRDTLPVDGGPIDVVGASLGGTIALTVLAEVDVPIRLAVLVNAAIRAGAAAELVGASAGSPYVWTDEARALAHRYDFVARASEIAARAPQPRLLVVSGDEDHPALRVDARDLVAELGKLYTDPSLVELAPIPGLAHPLGDPPGLEPAPRLPIARVVDETVTTWLTDHARPRA
jgi:pimeloyl-ACP methyl ester carboxylesterase